MNFLDGMATFVRVVDVGTLSKAARALRVSAAAVSRQLTALEAEMGAKLLVRTTRGFSITEEGRRFYLGAQRTLAEADETRRSVKSGRDVSGTLTVSIPTPLALANLDRTLPELLSAHLSLSIHLRLEDHVVDLVGEGVDIAVRVGLDLPDSAGVVAHPLVWSRRTVVAAPGYLRAQGTPTSPDQLARHTIVVHVPSSGQSRTSWSLRRGDETKSVDVHGRYAASSLLAVRGAALSSAGLALLPHWMVKGDLQTGALRAIDLGGFEAIQHRIYALHRTELRSLGRVTAFLEHAKVHILPPKANE